MVDYVAPRAARARRRRERELEVRGFVRRLDWTLLLAVATLVGMGLWAIDGITRFDIEGDSNYYVVRQAAYAALGTVGLLVATVVDPDLYRRHKRAVYGLTIGLIVAVALLGAVERGSRRWIDLGFFRFQPSEFGKLLLILFLAALLADRTRRLREARTVLTTIGLALVPIILVFLQPDIGTALVYVSATAAVLFVAGVRWTHLAALGTTALVATVSILWLLPAADVHVLKEYQTERLTAFTNPDDDPGGATYNANQSLTAVGSGGVSGRGVLGASQTRLDYLPEHHTDFAFASFAEQRGFVGAALLLGLYLLVVWRGLRIVTRARDAFSAIVAGGIVGAFLFQVFVNVGMTMGIAPITGIPLPFVSVGGSALITNLTAVGVLLAICARGQSE
ncbi:MAG: rod shape-determining protein RodA [Actinobacteria bacterium]|nr:rod shape-determining protein RodA [Actinomycetota bacterium]